MLFPSFTLKHLGLHSKCFRTKSFSAFWPRANWSESKKIDEAGRDEAHHPLLRRFLALAPIHALPECGKVLRTETLATQPILNFNQATFRHCRVRLNAAFVGQPFSKQQYKISIGGYRLVVRHLVLCVNLLVTTLALILAVP